MTHKLALGENFRIVTKSGGTVIVPDSAVSATLVTDTQLNDFRSWYPDGSVTSPRQFTELNYNWNAADPANHAVSAFQFAGSDKMQLSATNRDKTGRVVIPPYVDRDGVRYTVTGIGFGPGSSQFDDWTGAGITEVVIPETVTKIGSRAFYGCSELKFVTIPNSVSSVTGSNEFAYCTGLEEVFVGRGVKLVSDSTYYECPRLRVVDFGPEPRNEIPAIVNGQMAFPSTCRFVVPDKNYDAWVANPQWAAFIANGYKVVRHSEWDSPHRYEISVTLSSTVNSNNNVVYTLYQNGLSVGGIEVPEGVKSGSIVDVEFRDNALWDDTVNVTEVIKGAGGIATEADAGAYIKLVTEELGNDWTYTGSYETFELPPTYNSLCSRWESYSEKHDMEFAQGGYKATELQFTHFRASRSPEHAIYIKTRGFGGEYTMEPDAPQVQLSVKNDIISARIKPGTLTRTELTESVNDSLSLADTALQDVLNPEGAQISLTRCEVENQPRISASINESAVNTREIANGAVTSEKIGIVDESTGELYTISIFDGRVILKLVNPPSVGDTIFKFYGAYNENYTVEGELNKEVLIENGLLDSAGNWVKQPKAVMVGTKVTSIGDTTLAGCDVEYVQIPDSVTGIGKGTFENCLKLSTVILPNGLTNLDDHIFWQCVKLSSLALPNSLNRIGSYVFYYCRDLLSVDVPDSVTVVDEGAFNGCISLSSVNLPNNLTKISPNTFYNCPKLSGISLPAALREIGYHAFCYCTDLSAVTIPYYVRSIGEGAFSECSGITSAVFGNSLLSVGGYAFYDCSSLVYVKVPNATTYMGPHPFQGCPEELFDTTSVEGVGLVDGWAVSGDLNYDGYVDLTNARGIAGGVFEECSCVTGVTLPPNITNIPPYAFSGCRGIKSMAIPNTVTFIGYYGLAGCGFTTLTIPNSVTYVDEGGLAGCDFTTVQLPQNLTEITYNMFGSCRYLSSIAIPEGVSCIHGSAFSGCWRLEGVTLPSTLKEIGDNAFRVTTRLESITIPSSVTTLGREAFHYTTANSTGMMDVVMEGRTMAEVRAMDYFPWGLVKGAAFICTDGIIIVESGGPVFPYPDIKRTILFDKEIPQVWQLIKDGELNGRWIAQEVVHLNVKKFDNSNAVAVGTLYVKPDVTTEIPDPPWIRIELNPPNGLKFTGYSTVVDGSTYDEPMYEHHWQMETVTESDPVSKRILALFPNEIINVIDNYDIPWE